MIGALLGGGLMLLSAFGMFLMQKSLINYEGGIG